MVALLLLLNAAMIMVVMGNGCNYSDGGDGDFNGLDCLLRTDLNST